MFQKELALQETMSERIEVRKDLRKCERKIKELDLDANSSSSGVDFLSNFKD